MTSIDYGLRNRAHYDLVFQATDRDQLLDKVRNFDAFLDEATVTDTSWVGLYVGNFRHNLRGRRILELGAGDGLNALIMAALGADVVAVDIAAESARVIRDVASRIRLSGEVEALTGDLADMDFASGGFDYVVGKAFLHHLTHEQEDAYLRAVSKVLRPYGEARFFEPAQNSEALDWLRWTIPVPGRPSSLNRGAFREWRARDPHPERDNSSAHYRRVAERYFRDVEILPLGGIERLHRVLPRLGNRAFRRLAFRLEAAVPRPIQLRIARSQTLLLRQPRP